MAGILTEVVKVRAVDEGAGHQQPVRLSDGPDHQGGDKIAAESAGSGEAGAQHLDHATGLDAWSYAGLETVKHGRAQVSEAVRGKMVLQYAHVDAFLAACCAELVTPTVPAPRARLKLEPFNLG